MSDERYFLRERGRETGPFTVAQLRAMRRENRLARFHKVSSDGRTWVGIETLPEVFQPGPASPGGKQAVTPAPAALWYYASGSEARGPVDTPTLQALIDRREIGRTSYVRSEHADEWTPCEQLGVFRFEPTTETPTPAAEVAAADPGRSTAWLVAPVVTIVVVAVGVGVFLLAQSPGRTDPADADPGPRVNKAATPATPKAEPAPTPPPEEPPKAPPAPKAGPARAAPKAVARAAPPPEPDPAAAPFGETRTASVRLPDASDVRARHDSADTVLDVPLPSATRFALRLRGLDDAGMQPHKLVARPTDPGRADALTVVHAPNGKAGTGAEVRELARFRVEGGRLHFRWAEELTSSLVAPAGGLRDCVLEVKGGGTRVNVVLRPAAVDPQGLTAKQGRRDVDWKPSGGRPVRGLVIQACEINDGGGWRDVPATADPSRRARRLDGTAGAATEGVPALEVVLKDGTALVAMLTPSAQRLSRDIASLANKKRARTQDLVTLRAGIKDGPRRLKALQDSLRTGRTSVKNYEANLRGLSATRMTSVAAFERFNEYRALLDDTNLKIAADEGEFEILSEQLPQWEKEAETIESALDDLKARLDELERTSAQRKAAFDDSIRVKLGTVVDGETVGVARVGPW